MSLYKVVVLCSVLVLTACNSAGVKSASDVADVDNAGQPSVSTPDQTKANPAAKSSQSSDLQSASQLDINTLKTHHIINK